MESGVRKTMPRHGMTESEHEWEVVEYARKLVPLRGPMPVAYWREREEEAERARARQTTLAERPVGQGKGRLGKETFAKQ